MAVRTQLTRESTRAHRSFVRDLTVDDADAAIVDTIIVMAHTLSMKVVAEGVETSEQERYLADRDCDEAQGYLYSAGLSADKLVDVIHSLARDETP